MLGGGVPKENSGGFADRIGSGADDMPEALGLVLNTFGFLRSPCRDGFSSGIDDMASAVHEGDVRVLIEDIVLLLQAGGFEEVVVGQDFSVGATEVVKAGVPVAEEAEALGVRDDVEAWVIELRDDREGVVGGLVVEDDAFEIGEGLIEDGLKGLSDVFLCVVEGNSDGDFGGGSFHAAMAFRWRGGS